MKKENIEARLDNIEEILKMLLVNSLFENDELEKIQENIINMARTHLLSLGMKNLRLNYIEKEYFLFAEIDESDSLKNIRNNYARATGLLENVKLVLAFDKLHSKRKKAFEEAGISFYIKNCEMKIF